MSADIENDAEVIQRFGDWAITKDGLENFDHGYFIEKRRLGETRLTADGVSEWALHMFEKTWVDTETFIPALKAAVALYAPENDIDWDKTMAKLRDEAYTMMCFDEAKRRVLMQTDGNGRQYQTMGDLEREAQRLKDCAWYPKTTR